ncbi:MAG: DUF4386 domain-containing protein [Bacteriovoracaceae bacterium]|nr:DUF4386 domain-containing protein [Bacteriovoracaceae bacterium]
MENKKLARITGVFYLLIILCGLFSEGFVRMGLIVPGDAAQTVLNIKGSELLFRFGFLSDLVMVVADIVVAVLFYYILKPVGQIAATFATVFRLGQATVIGMNLLNHLSPLLLFSITTEETWTASQINEQVMMFMQGHRNGYLISQVLFSVNCGFMGYLLIKSKLFPKLLGIGVSAAGVVYLVDAVVNFLNPSLAPSLEVLMVVPVLAEFGLCLWLLIKGVTKLPADKFSL